ncbi:MAG: hypothetical protein U0169_17765 [Polyangiaceae bacterium]
MTLVTGCALEFPGRFGYIFRDPMESLSLRARSALDQHPQKAALTAFARRMAERTLADGRAPGRDAAATTASEVGLDGDGAKTEFGDAIAVLGGDVSTDDERALAQALARLAFESKETDDDRDDIPAPQPALSVVGELSPAPRSATATTLLAITGLLFVVGGARLFARHALAFRSPAVLHVDGRDVRIRAETTLLGRTLRSVDTRLESTSLLHATREVRFPRLGLYAGLVALAFGSFVGVTAMVDGARASSPSLLGTGLFVVLVGIVTDFVLSSVLPGTTGRCRVVLVPRRGPVFCVGDVQIAEADRVIQRLASR